MLLNNLKGTLQKENHGLLLVFQQANIRVPGTLPFLRHIKTTGKDYLGHTKEQPRRLRQTTQGRGARELKGTVAFLRSPTRNPYQAVRMGHRPPASPLPSSQRWDSKTSSGFAWEKKRMSL